MRSAFTIALTGQHVHAFTFSSRWSAADLSLLQDGCHNEPEVAIPIMVLCVSSCTYHSADATVRLASLVPAGAHFSGRDA